MNPAAHINPDELELQRDEAEQQKRETRGKAIMNKYLEIDKTDHGAAESYLSNILHPKGPLQLSMADEETGQTLNAGEAIEKLTDRMVERCEGGAKGDPVFNKWVRGEVKRCRASARVEVVMENEICFSWEMVLQAIRGAGRRQASMRLPRLAARAGLPVGRVLLWTLLNFIGASGVVPAAWIREMTPIRKQGHGPVADDAVLRPVSYVDDLENAFDAVWLASTREKLEAYMGEQQSGGRYDYVLVVIGVLITLQSRLGQQLPTHLMVADLWHGYELVWRDAIRLHCKWAGVSGRMWLVLDAALQLERVRLRVGGAIGEVAILTQFSIGQGKRSGVHQFGIFTRGLFDECREAGVNVGVGVPMPAIAAYRAARKGLIESTSATNATGGESEESWEQDVWLEASASRLRGEVMQIPWNETFSCLTKESGLRLIDFLASHRVEPQQFVDDSIVPVGSVQMLARVSKALSKFVTLWQHAYQGGKKARRY
jgi:hypothetical protein